jgi:hypothetical protein
MLRPGSLAAALVACAAAGCTDDSVYSSGGDADTRRAARAVVRANLTALARGDARTFCGSYTPRFLRVYRDSYATCVRAFRDPPKPGARPPRIVWKDFLTATDEKVAVAFTADGGANQTYYLEYRRPVPQAGAAPRWLIDQEAVERE